MLWTEKYKPKGFHDYIGNREIVNALRQYSNDVPHLMFIGPRGVGKKTLAKILVKKFLGSAFANNFLYIDLSRYAGPLWFRSKSDWGYNDVLVAERYNVVSVKDFAFSLPFGVPFKVAIIDEINKLDFLSQQALRVIIERSSSMTRFILIGTTNVNIIDPIMSRVVQYRFKSLQYDEFAKILKKVLEGEKIKYDQRIIPLLFNRVNSNVFAAITILNSLKDFTFEEVKDATAPDAKFGILFYHVQRKNLKKIRESIQYLVFNLNYSPEEIVKGFVKYIEESNLDLNLKIKLIDEIASNEAFAYVGYENFIQLENLFMKLTEIFD